MTLRIESPLSKMYPWTIAALESTCSSFATRLQHVSLLFDLILPHRPFQPAYFRLRLVPLPAVSVYCLMYRPSPVMKRKKVFLARVEWLPVTSHSHGQIVVTNRQCKISIMMMDIQHVPIHTMFIKVMLCPTLLCRRSVPSQMVLKT